MNILLNHPCWVYLNLENQQRDQQWVWMNTYKENSQTEVFLKVTSSFIFEYEMCVKCPLEIVSLIQREKKLCLYF